MAAFSPEVERWRSLVAKYFPPQAVDQALMIMQLESGGRNIPSGYNAGGGEDSHGLFQINLRAHGGRINRQQVYDPEQNIAYAARLFADQGWGPWSASRTDSFKKFMSSGQSAGGVQAPRPQDFMVEDPFTGNSVMDTESYYRALNQYEAYRRWGQEDNAAYYDAIIDEIGLELEAGKLKLAQAEAEFNRRFSALQEGNKQFANLVGYAIPQAGGPYPNSEFYAGMGLQPTIPATSTIDPFAMALDVVNQTPNLTELGVPTGFQGISEMLNPNNPNVVAPAMADPFGSALENMNRLGLGTWGNASALSNMFQDAPWVTGTPSSNLAASIGESPAIQNQVNRSGLPLLGSLGAFNRAAKYFGNQIAEPTSSLGLYSQARKFLSGGLGKFLP